MGSKGAAQVCHGHCCFFQDLHKYSLYDWMNFGRLVPGCTKYSRWFRMPLCPLCLDCPDIHQVSFPSLKCPSLYDDVFGHPSGSVGQSKCGFLLNKNLLMKKWKSFQGIHSFEPTFMQFNHRSFRHVLWARNEDRSRFSLVCWKWSAASPPLPRAFRKSQDWPQTLVSEDERKSWS